jgi:dihydrofolate reductase
VSDTSTGNGKVVVNRSMSLDGFTAGPGDGMNWIFDFMGPIEDEFPEIMAATGAMLVGRRTYEVGKRMAENPNEITPAYDGGAEFVLTHEPPDPPDPAVTFLTGDIGEAVATAFRAASGKNLEILGADVAGQCLRRGLVDEIMVFVLPVLLGDGTRYVLLPGPRQDRPGTARQHTVRSRHNSAVPRPQVVPGYVVSACYCRYSRRSRTRRRHPRNWLRSVRVAAKHPDGRATTVPVHAGKDVGAGSLVGCGQVSAVRSGCGPVRHCWPGSRWALTR